MKPIEAIVTDRVLFLNAAAGFLSLSEIDMMVKIGVGIAAIVYTVSKTIKVIQDIKNNEK